MTPLRWFSPFLIFACLFSAAPLQPTIQQPHAAASTSTITATSQPTFLPLVTASTPSSIPTVRPWPDTSAKILPFDDQVALDGLSDAQWQFVATRFAGTQKVTRATARHLRQYNPNFLVLHYRLGQGLGHSLPEACKPTTSYLQIIQGDSWVQEWPGDSVVQEEWFYHYSGSRVFNCDYGHYLMDLDNAAWRGWWSAQVIQQMTDNEDDGLFADSFNVPSYGFTWSPTLPVEDTVFEAEWAARQHAFTDYIRGQFAGRYKWIPNVGSWITTRDPSDYSNVDGVMIEGFAEGGYGSYYPEEDWKLEMNRILPLIKTGKILIAQTYPSPDDINERMFVLGTYLLVKGSQTYINLEANEVPEWYPEYGLNLGAATDPLPAAIADFYNSTWNVYVRHYANGLVLVNPGAASQTVALGQTYYQVTPAGGGVVPEDGSAPGTLSTSAVTQVTLSPNQAVVLMNQP